MSQIKSKTRVRESGEVFTSYREVNAMLDLVKDECLRVESMFLEPACGNGNFLIEILRRKLSTVVDVYTGAKLEQYALIALSTLYGIDILPDNVVECRKRLLNLMVETVSESFAYIECASTILSRNIIHGDTLKCLDLSTGSDIIIYEWCVDELLNLSSEGCTLRSMYE